MQQTWIEQQIRSMHHLIALIGIAGIMFCAGFFRDNMVVYVGYALFFLVTAWSMLKTMIVFSIVVGVLVAIFPFLAPIAFIVMIVFFFMRINYIIKHWRPVVVGLIVYGFGVFLIYSRYKFLSCFLPYSMLDTLYRVIGNKILLLLPGADALLCAVILHFLLVWLYKNGYNSSTALGIMGGVPLVLIALLLPFLKVFAESGPAVDFGDAGHGGHGMSGEHITEGYGTKGAPGYTYVKSYVRTAPDGIADNNLSAGHGDVSEANLQVVKGHWRSNPDGIAENNLSYHGAQPDTASAPQQALSSQEPIKAPFVCDYSKQGEEKKSTSLSNFKQAVANNKRLTGLLVLSLVVLGFSYQYFNSKSDIMDKKSPVVPNKSVQNSLKATVTQQQPKKIKKLETADFVLANVKLGSNITDVKRTLSEPLQVETGKNVTLYKAPSLGVEFSVIDRQGHIGSIVIDKNIIATSRGISVGDSLSKVTAAYGEAVITSYGNYNLYEYFYEGATKYILRFAVGKNSQKVEYIGVRLGE